jgi:hypothetical protein
MHLSIMLHGILNMHFSQRLSIFTEKHHSGCAI